MTSFVAWVGIDSRWQSSLYLASDSRITWDQESPAAQKWDFGRKVFACTAGPHLFGYVGDVTFASLLLSQITSAADAGVLFGSARGADQRFVIVRKRAEEAFAGLPTEQRRKVSIAYATRDGEGMHCAFSLWVLHWAPDSGWTPEPMSMPSVSSVLS